MRITTIAWRNAIANRSQLAFTALAVVLSVAFLTATLIVTDSITGTAESDLVEANANVSFVVEGATIAEGGGGPGEAADRISASLRVDLIDQIAKIDGVESVAGEIVGFAKLVTNGEAVGKGTATDVGMGWIARPDLNPFRLVEGSAPTGVTEVVLPRNLAKDGGVGVGDSVQVLTPLGLIDATVSGLATFGNADSAPLARVVLFDETVAPASLAQDGFSRIRIATSADADLEVVRGSLLSTAPDLVVLDNATYVAARQTAVRSPFAFLSMFLFAFAAIATAAGVTIIFNTLVIAIGQRRREFALMRAVGAQRGQVLRTVLAESAIIAVLATGLGLGVGLLAARFLRRVMDLAGLSFLDGPLVATRSTILIAVVVGVVLTIGSALGPTRSAASAAPIEALRVASAEPSRVSPIRSIAGVLLLCGGLGTTIAAGVTRNSTLLAGLGLMVPGFILAGPFIVTGVASLTRPIATRLGGVIGAIASTNLSRNPRRASSTSLGLTLGVSLVAFFAVLASSINASFSTALSTQVRADVVATSASPDVATIDPNLVDRLKGVPNASAAALAIADASVDGEAALLAGIDPNLPELFDFAVSAGSLDELAAGGIAVSSDLEVVPALGETVVVALRAGKVELPVVALFDETLAGFDAPEYLVSGDLLGTLEPGLPDWLVFASGLNDSSREALRAVIADTPGSLYETRASYLDNAGAEANAIRNLVYALLGLTVVIAVLGVANTTALSISERVREIGLMRAIGTTRAGVRRVIRWEATTLALFGTLSGLATAMVAGWAFVRAAGGADITTIAFPWLVFGVLMVGAIGTSMVTTAVPAHRASRIPTLDAISSN